MFNLYLLLLLVTIQTKEILKILRLIARRNLSMSKNQHHVVPNSKTGGWDVKLANVKCPIAHFDKKADAKKAGREISIYCGTELIIHGKDGRIQCSDSHGNDPCPPKDKR